MYEVNVKILEIIIIFIEQSIAGGGSDVVVLVASKGYLGMAGKGG